MRLTAVANNKASLSDTLPLNHPALRSLQMHRGQVSLTVAAPGVGKSVLWLNLAMRMGVPSLFWSADTSAYDVLLRSMAMWSGQPMSHVESTRRDPAWAAYYTNLLHNGAHVDWVFDPAITPEVVGERLKAFMEIRGPDQYPHLFVLDNLLNTVQHQQDELAEQKEVMAEMHRLAVRTNAHIAILAHAKGEYDSATKPIPQGGVLNNLFKIPSLGITLFRGNDAGDDLGVCVVKNRGGRADPGAKHPIHLSVDYSRATVSGFERVAA